MKAWLQPKSFERRYQRYLKKTAEQVRKEFLFRLGYIFKLKNYIKYEPGPDDLILEDESDLAKKSDDINLAIAGLMAWWLLQRQDVRATIRGYYQGVNLYNDKQFTDVVKSLTGMTLPPTTSAPYRPGGLVSNTSDLLNRFGDTADIYRQEPYLQGVEENWVSTQETYLDKTVTQAIGDAELIVRNGIVISSAADIILSAINNKFNTVDKRVNSFADDQINSLDSQLTKQRQLSIGIDQYIWVTKRDERVRGNPNGLYPKARPSHFHRDKQIFSWRNPPEGGHPGEAPNCRCIAYPGLAR